MKRVVIFALILNLVTLCALSLASVPSDELKDPNKQTQILEDLINHNESGQEQTSIPAEKTETTKTPQPVVQPEKSKTDTAFIEVHREMQYVGCMRREGVNVDGKELGIAHDGETITIPVTLGHHTVYTKVAGLISPPVNVDLSAGETAHLESTVVMGFWVNSVKLYQIQVGQSQPIVSQSKMSTP